MKSLRMVPSVLVMVALLWTSGSQAGSARSRAQGGDSPLLRTAHAQADAPAARYGASMAFDSTRNVTVMFGGCLGNCSGFSNITNETWEFDGLRWRQVTTASTPSPRHHAGMAYDRQRRVIVLFGGRGCSYECGDTWEYDGSDWVPVTTTSSPLGRTAAMAYDTDRQVVVLSSGHRGTYCNSGTYFGDTWEYDGMDWVERLPSGGALNELPSLAYDPDRRTLVHLVGRYYCDLRSETWTYDSVNWTHQSPATAPPLTSGPIAYEHGLGRTVLFGGCTAKNSDRCTAYSDDLWAYDSTTWSLIDVPARPPGRYFHSVAYDTARSKLVVFGGCRDYHWGWNCTDVLDDLWEFDGANWRQVDPHQTALDCSEPQIYYSVQHCTQDSAEILFIDPTDSRVRVETRLAWGYDYDDNPGECRDVNTPARVSVHSFPGPRCHVWGDDTVYPAELVGDMATRDADDVAALAFNADYFAQTYEWGPQGLTVKNGDRFDGPCYGDDDGGGYNGRNNYSLAIARDGNVQIAVAGSEAPDECDGSGEPFVTDPGKYWNAVGGGPLLVEQGVSVVERECDTPNRYCPYRFTSRARTAVGKAADGRLIVAVVPEPPGIILDDSQNPELEDLSELMISLGAVEAMNLDGGGSSQLWYNGDYLVPSSDARRVPEGMLIFSDTICPVEAALDQVDSAAEYRALDIDDLISLYWRVRDEVLAASGLGQEYIEDYDQHGSEVTGILLRDSDLRSRTARFLENAAPAFGSLLPDSNEEVVLTQVLYDEAESLVRDLASAGSQELRQEMSQTWASLALDRHVGETATEIWRQMQDYAVYLPIILK